MQKGISIHGLTKGAINPHMLLLLHGVDAPVWVSVMQLRLLDSLKLNSTNVKLLRALLFRRSGNRRGPSNAALEHAHRCIPSASAGQMRLRWTWRKPPCCVCGGLEVAASLPRRQASRQQGPQPPLSLSDLFASKGCNGLWTARDNIPCPYREDDLRNSGNAPGQPFWNPGGRDLQMCGK